MEISRTGHRADYGPAKLKLNAVVTSWNSATNCVVFNSKGVRDWSGSSNHNYSVSLSLEDCAKIIKLLGGDLANTHAEPIAEQLTPSLRELLRLVSACTGRTGTIR